MKTSWHCWRCREQGVVEHKVDHRPEVVRRLILRDHQKGSSCGDISLLFSHVPWSDISTNRDVA